MVGSNHHRRIREILMDRLDAEVDRQHRREVRRARAIGLLRLAGAALLCIGACVAAFLLSGCNRNTEDSIVNVWAADTSAGIPHPGHYILYLDTTGIDTLTPPAGGTRKEVAKKSDAL